MQLVSFLGLFGLLLCAQGTSASGSCSRQQKELACRLFRNSNVVAAKSHPSGEQDNAFAYNNLRDMCNGGQASRSSYRCNAKCHAPGGSTCLSLDLLTYLDDLTKSGIVQINELAGACHSCNSRHFSGLAVDLHKYASRKATYISRCRTHSGYPIEERNHIHCQFYDGRHPNFQN
ncbi:hypothetical protein ACOMHN_017553 [Nucella lapillus]